MTTTAAERTRPDEDARAARRRARRPGPSVGIPGAEVLRMAVECADELTGHLGFRPAVHAGWRPDVSLPAPVVDALLEAVEAALLEVHCHGGATTVIVAIELGNDAVEVCAVDNGSPAVGRRIGRLVVDEPSGIEHGVEEYEGYGTCQWWSIPLDVVASAR